MSYNIDFSKMDVRQILTYCFHVPAEDMKGDSIGDVHPFEIYDDIRIDHLYQTLDPESRHRIQMSSYDDFQHHPDIALFREKVHSFINHFGWRPNQLNQRVCFGRILNFIKGFFFVSHF